MKKDRQGSPDADRAGGLGLLKPGHVLVRTPQGNEESLLSEQGSVLSSVFLWTTSTDKAHNLFKDLFGAGELPSDKGEPRIHEVPR